MAPKKSVTTPAKRQTSLASFFTKKDGSALCSPSQKNQPSSSPVRGHSSQPAKKTGGSQSQVGEDPGAEDDHLPAPRARTPSGAGSKRKSVIAILSDDDEVDQPKPKSSMVKKDSVDNGKANTKASMAAAPAVAKRRRDVGRPAKRARTYDDDGDDDDDDPDDGDFVGGRDGEEEDDDDDDVFMDAEDEDVKPTKKKSAPAKTAKAKTAAPRLAKQEKPTPAASNKGKGKTVKKEEGGKEDADKKSKDVEDAEARKKAQKAAYFSQQRQRTAGPAAPGSKEVPEGQPNCLQGLTFVFTGELSSLSRDEAIELAKRYGGNVTTAPSGRTSYVVVGENAGAKKLEAIKAKKIPTLDEDEFLDLIATRDAGDVDEKTKKKLEAEEKKIKEAAKAMGSASQDGPNVQLWTVKYAPKTPKDVVGNKGQVEKLQSWLQAWPKSLASGFKKPGPHGMNGFRCILISGSPGIGKTTAAHMVARLEGFTPIELNASDTRSKKLLEAAVTDTLNNTNLNGWMSKGKQQKTVDGVTITNRTCLIMDEVDGMSGGDRGGVGAINALIKKTKIPIICICNDKSNPKMKPLLNTSFQLPFRKPEKNAIRSRLMSIAFREGMKIPAPVMDQLVEGSQSDIRQVVNMLSTWRLSNTTMDFEEGKALSLANVKNAIQTPWTLYASLMSPYMFSRTSKATINDKTDLYFQDHSFMPLFVQENYLKQNPSLANGLPGREGELKRIELATKAASSMSDGDLVDAMIHGTQQHWSLMPFHGVMSCVRPASFMFGGGGGVPGGGYGGINFPAWLGNNSKQQRLARALGDIQVRMRLRTSGDRNEIRQTYLSTLASGLTKPLAEEGAAGVDEVVSLMDDYFLGLEEREAALELVLEDANAGAEARKIPTATKSALTRKYNAASHPVAFQKAFEPGKAKAIKSEGPPPDVEEAYEEDAEVADEEADGDGDSEEGDVDLAKDKMVKMKNAKGKGKSKAGGAGSKRKK